MSILTEVMTVRFSNRYDGDNIYIYCYKGKRMYTVRNVTWFEPWAVTQVKVKVKSSVARSLPVENLLPQNVGSIINYLQ